MVGRQPPPTTWMGAGIAWVICPPAENHCHRQTSGQKVLAARMVVKEAPESWTAWGDHQACQSCFIKMFCLASARTVPPSPAAWRG